MTETISSPIDAQTRLVGVMGYPIEHSLSPLIHNTAFRVQQLNCCYVALPVQPGDLAHAVKGLRALRFLGANVTLPHKQAMLPLLDELSDTARAVGAVNTVVCRFDDHGTLLYGDNTDVTGFLEPLHAIGADLQRASMVVLGAGGAACAVVYALLTTFTPHRLTLAARSPARAERMAAELATYDACDALRVVPLKKAGPVIRECQLLINTTPVGMHPHTDATPWPDTSDFHKGQVIYDLIYRPTHTHLLQGAAQRGAQTLGGLPMLLHQAAAAYRQWTGQHMPLDAVRHAVLATHF